MCIRDRLNINRSKSRTSGKSVRSVEQLQKQSYYMKSLEYYLSVKKSSSNIAKLYQEHFIETIAALKYVRKLRIPSDDAMASIRMNCAKINQVKAKSKIPCF